MGLGKNAKTLAPPVRDREMECVCLCCIVWLAWAGLRPLAHLRTIEGATREKLVSDERKRGNGTFRFFYIVEILGRSFTENTHFHTIT